jgi:hypothetical protein
MFLMRINRVTILFNKIGDEIMTDKYNKILPFSSIPAEPLDTPPMKYPFLVVRFMPAVYQREQIDIRQGEAAVHISPGSCFLRHPDPFDGEGAIRESCRALLLEGVMAAVLRTQLRMCVVWAADKASYVERDRTIKVLNSIPSGGFMLPSKIAFDAPEKVVYDKDGNIENCSKPRPKH